jgi:hypothetical protein
MIPGKAKAVSATVMMAPSVRPRGEDGDDGADQQCGPHTVHHVGEEVPPAAVAAEPGVPARRLEALDLAGDDPLRLGVADGEEVGEQREQDQQHHPARRHPEDHAEAAAGEPGTRRWLDAVVNDERLLDDGHRRILGSRAT